MDEVEDFYENFYSKVFSDKGASSFFNSLTHKTLEMGLSSTSHPSMEPGLSILEIGAGKGEHLPYVKQKYQNYDVLDILPKPENFDVDQKVNYIQEDICDLDIELGQYDRIISMCVFHHLSNPTNAMVNIKKHLNNGGVFSLFLPSDPGFLNRLNRKLFVTPKAQKEGFEHYELVNAREHKNHYWSLKTQLNHEFRGYKISKRYYPFGIPMGNLSLFSIWHIQSSR
jgi:phosphatidylethanolamine/phosphatidyl-N-methylethanolamine N-methyltransferase